MTDQPSPEISLDDILAELTPHGRELIEQAIGSAQRSKVLRAEMARMNNAAQPGSAQSGGVRD